MAKAKIYRLPAQCFSRGMFWPVDWTGPEREAHIRALEMSIWEDVVVEFENRIVAYHMGGTSLI